mmetsp:Transcript_7601/g.19882  ORF Transcript_7601/g.19882 Transcript_7601/m.19882 type:complete len:335 (-) Transcript_7601:60-1064(-)
MAFVSLPTLPTRPLTLRSPLIAPLSFPLLTPSLSRPSRRPSSAPFSLSASVPPEDPELTAVLATAVAAARAAGAAMLAGSSSAEIIATKLNPKDLLTQVDCQCQEIIRGIVVGSFPGHAFLGEEDIAPGPEAAAAAVAERVGEEWLWIVDPIDGTINFALGMPLSAVSIGVTRRGELAVGVIFDPHRDELFTATLKSGAFLNGRPILVDPLATSAGSAVVAAGSPPSTRQIGPSLRGCAALMPRVRTLRMLGSAAIMLAWVACGRLSAYFEPDLHAWDSAAGALLVREAGGRVTDLVGVEYTVETRPLMASNGVVHEEILEILREVGVTGLDPA